MRISDWSSDVCSSDLVVEEPAHVRGDRRREIAACLRGLYRVGPGRQPVQPHIHGPQAIHAFRENAVVEDDQRVVDGCTSLSECIAEIGSASWWESVCQYV